MDTNQSITLVIKEHDFLEAKNSLKKYTEQAEKDVELSRVPSDGGLFKLGKHKVTGPELNRITSQIQDYLISLNNLSQGLVEEFGQVYKAFEYLDKDYISGIVASIKAAEKVSKKEQQDRKDIKELVEQHKQSIAVLKKFKADIEKLKHLTDIDKAWELIEKQTKLSKKLSDYIADLAKLKHIKDVDVIYTDLETIIREFAKVSELQTMYVAELKTVREFCNTLSAVKHIKDVDKLWAESETFAKDISRISESLNVQGKVISSLEDTIRGLAETQQKYIESINQSLSEYQDDLNSQVRTLAENQALKIKAIEDAHRKVTEQLTVEQREWLLSVENNQKEVLGFVLKKQTIALNDIEREQKETLEQLSKNQSDILEQLSKEQAGNREQIIKELKEEKAALNEQVAVIAQKAKYAYYIAGGTAALVIVQFVLNLLGVI